MSANFTRRFLLLASCVTLVGGQRVAGQLIDESKAEQRDKVDWYDIQLLGVEGKAFAKTKAPFDRLPAKAEKTVRKPVWSLSRHSAGMCVRFETDSPKLHARWTLTSTNLAMRHMPATGVSGLDLYVRHEGKWRWLGVGQPSAVTQQSLLASPGAGKRQYLLYLPLYNGVKSVEIGVEHSRRLSKLPRSKNVQPIVFYGTSITQGGCASRTGMVHTAILGRRLDYPVVNLGFSGNGTMDPSIGQLMAEIDAAAYVIDCLPNMSAKAVAKRTEPLVRQLRKLRPTVPILLVEDRSYSNSFLIKTARQRNLSSRRELKAAFARLQKSGVQGLYYLAGESLLGDDNLGTVDGSHPTDLGFLRMADQFEPILTKMLR